MIFTLPSPLWSHLTRCLCSVYTHLRLWSSQVRRLIERQARGRWERCSVSPDPGWDTRILILDTEPGWEISRENTPAQTAGSGSRHRYHKYSLKSPRPVTSDGWENEWPRIIRNEERLWCLVTTDTDTHQHERIIIPLSLTGRRLHPSPPPLTLTGPSLSLVNESQSDFWLVPHLPPHTNTHPPFDWFLLVLAWLTDTTPPSPVSYDTEAAQ